MLKKNKHKNEINSKEPHKKRKLKKSAWSLILVGSLIIVLLSGFGIYTWFKDNKATNNLVEEIVRTTPVEEITAGEEDELVNQPSDENKSDPYWDYVKLPLISVDFKELIEKNSDTVGFIKVNNTNINYPVVQTDNNDFYLNHAFDKSKNGGGWVYLDYRNDINNLKHNTVIYAHGRKNNTMFGSLKNAVKKEWYENNSNHVINISTPEVDSLWQVISVYTIPTETYYLTTNFGTEENHQKFIDTILSRSVYNFNTQVNTNDKLLTLSTCLNDDIKIVLHAKLIKKQAR